MPELTDIPELTRSEPIELSPDPTPILTIPPDEPEEELTEEEQQLKLKKAKAQKCKVIVLYRMGHHPVNTNVSQLRQQAKLEILNQVKELMDKPDDEITDAFNKIVCEVVLEQNADISQYPVYKTTIKK
jgi:hypothetical protein